VKRVMQLKKQKKKNNNKEDGQAVVEFALVLPIFLLLIFAIIDFGWLFYNYINVENSARNAARIACVEFSDCCIDDWGNSEGIKTLTYQDMLNYDSAKSGANTNNNNSTVISKSEYDIISSVMDTIDDVIPESEYDSVSIMVHYTYDDSYVSGLNNDSFDVGNRYKGDVEVNVKCNMKVLTPVLGVTCDNMTKTITSSSTFRVEKQS
jgi:hypothetical protein